MSLVKSGKDSEACSCVKILIICIFSKRLSDWVLCVNWSKFFVFMSIYERISENQQYTWYANATHDIFKKRQLEKPLHQTSSTIKCAKRIMKCVLFINNPPTVQTVWIYSKNAEIKLWNSWSQSVNITAQIFEIFRHNKWRKVRKQILLSSFEGKSNEIMCLLHNHTYEKVAKKSNKRKDVKAAGQTIRV